MSSPPPSWIEPQSDTEAAGGFRQLKSEIIRLSRRARARPLTVLLVASVATGSAVGRQALRQDRFAASTTFRVVERIEVTPEGSRPVTKRRLRDYVAEGIFTRQRCGRLVEKHGLYPEWQGLSLDRAVETFKDDIKIEVFQNYFLAETLADNATRTARLRISFSYVKAKVAEAVVRDLGKLIRSEEHSARRALAEHAERQSLLALEATEANIDRLRLRLAQTQMALSKARPTEAASLQVELGQLQIAVVNAEGRLRRVLNDQGTSTLRAGLERHGLLLRFNQTEFRSPMRPTLSRAARLMLVALVTFALFLPLSGIAVAAFDPAIYGPEDVRRLGFRTLARLDAFDDDNIGSLNERTLGDRVRGARRQRERAPWYTR